MSSRTSSSAGRSSPAAWAPPHASSTRPRWSAARPTSSRTSPSRSPASGPEVGTLSGGQRQQVAVARSLLGEPKVVLLDEPTAALGVAQTAQVLALIKRLRERGLGVVVISHNLSDVFEVTDRIFVLRLGRPEAMFETATAKSDEEVVAAITGARHRTTTNGNAVGGGR